MSTRQVKKSNRAIGFLEKIETGLADSSGRMFFFHWPCCKVNFALSLRTAILFFSGDELYARYCEGERNCEMEMAWDILDWYKKAVLLTHELEVEIEAIAISRIGRLYDKVFKLKSKARENFKAAIALALSMHPRTFNNDGETYFELQ